MTGVSDGYTHYRFEKHDVPREGYVTRVEYENRPGGPVAYSVQVFSKTRPVTARVIREIPVERLMTEDAITRPAEIPEKESGLPPALARQIKKMGGRILSTAEERKHFRAEQVRDIYIHAMRDGNPPAKAVAEVFSVSLATAGRRIRESKDLLGWE